MTQMIRRRMVSIPEPSGSPATEITPIGQENFARGLSTLRDGNAFSITLTHRASDFEISRGFGNDWHPQYGHLHRNTVYLTELQRRELAAELLAGLDGC